MIYLYFLHPNKAIVPCLFTLVSFPSESVVPPGCVFSSSRCPSIISVMSWEPRCPRISFTRWLRCCPSLTWPLSAGVWKLCWILLSVVKSDMKRMAVVRMSSMMTLIIWSRAQNSEQQHTSNFHYSYLYWSPSTNVKPKSLYLATLQL